MAAKPQFFDHDGVDAMAESFHYSQAVRVGAMVRTSGQGGFDPEGKLVPEVEEQIELAFKNVEQALRAVDKSLSWKNVYAVRSYHLDIEGTFDVVTLLFKKYMPDQRPVWTCIQVPKLGVQGMQIEVEVEASLA